MRAATFLIGLILGGVMSLLITKALAGASYGVLCVPFGILTVIITGCLYAEEK